MPESTPEVAKVPMFDDLTDAELQKIVEVGTEVTVPEHWSLIWEKTPADKAYIILDGEVVVRKGKDEVARLGPGDVVGESAIVNHKLRNASVVSTTPVRVLHFTREAVEQLCTEVPRFKAALDAAAGDRIGDARKGA
jgi:CRP/FNR family cyclic AMP-dependent transcriptional regulator